MLRQTNLSGAKNALETLLQLYDINSKEYQQTKTYLIKVDIVRRKLEK
jgi:hypothetical protein